MGSGCAAALGGQGCCLGEGRGSRGRRGDVDERLSCSNSKGWQARRRVIVVVAVDVVVVFVAVVQGCGIISAPIDDAVVPVTREKRAAACRRVVWAEGGRRGRG